MSNLKKIFVLCHEYTANEGDPDNEETELKELYYSFSQEKCSEQIEFYKLLPGFKDYPDGFEVMQIILENRYSETGFVKW